MDNNKLKALLARNIRNIREEKQEKQVYIAQISNISATQLSKIENGGVLPKEKTLRNIAKALNVTTGTLHSQDPNLAMQEVKRILANSGGIITRDDIDSLNDKALHHILNLEDEERKKREALKAKGHEPAFSLNEDMKSRIQQHQQDIDNLIYKIQNDSLEAKSIPALSNNLKKTAACYDLVIYSHFDFLKKLNPAEKFRDSYSQLLTFYKKAHNGQKACFFISNKLSSAQIRFRIAIGIFFHLFKQNHSYIKCLFEKLEISGNTEREIKNHEINILINILAARLLMPSNRFEEEGKSCDYDIGIMLDAFHVDDETLALRMVYIAKKKSFHFIKADISGNFVKTVSFNDFPFLPTGPACNRLGLNRALLDHGHIITQLSEDMANNNKYISVFKTIQQYIGAEHYPITYVMVLGCTLEYAEEISWIYLKNVNEKNPVKISKGCTECGQHNCESRGNARKPFDFDMRVRTKTPFSYFSPTKIDEFNTRINSYVAKNPNPS